MRRIIFGISLVLIIASVFVVSLALHRSRPAADPPPAPMALPPAAAIPPAGSLAPPPAAEPVPPVPVRPGAAPAPMTRSDPEPAPVAAMARTLELLEQRQNANVNEINELKSVIAELEQELKRKKRGEAEAKRSEEPDRGVRLPVADGKPETVLVLGAGVFRPGQVDLAEAARSSLAGILPVIRERTGTLVSVEGHSDSYSVQADSARAAEDNQRFSVMRAQAVARFLEEQGIGSDRILIRGYGAARPVASNATPGGRSQNRRVEIRLVPSRAAP